MIEALFREIEWLKGLRAKYNQQYEIYEPNSYQRGFCEAKINSYDVVIIHLEKIIRENQ